MSLKVLGLILATSHVLTIALIVLWFGLKKPSSAAEFWRRFKREFLSLSPID